MLEYNKLLRQTCSRVCLSNRIRRKLFGYDYLLRATTTFCRKYCARIDGSGDHAALGVVKTRRIFPVSTSTVKERRRNLYSQVNMHDLVKYVFFSATVQVGK